MVKINVISALSGVRGSGSLRTPIRNFYFLLYPYGAYSYSQYIYQHMHLLIYLLTYIHTYIITY